MAWGKGTYFLSPIPATHIMERDPAHTSTLQVNIYEDRKLKITQEGVWKDGSASKSTCCSLKGSGLGL